MASMAKITPDPNGVWKKAIKAERKRWLAVIQRMHSELPHSSPTKTNKWDNTKSHAKKEILQDLVFEVTGEEFQYNEEVEE